MLVQIIGSIRRNHALEHATVAVILSRLGPNVRLVGRAVPDGFFIYSNVPEPELAAAADEALVRLQRGEANLAVSPLCGTNIAVAGTLAGLAAILVMGSSDRWERLPNVVMSAMIAVLAAQPLGRLMQRHVTTSADLSKMRITRVQQGRHGRGRYLKVETASR